MTTSFDPRLWRVETPAALAGRIRLNNAGAALVPRGIRQQWRLTGASREFRVPGGGLLGALHCACVSRVVQCTIANGRVEIALQTAGEPPLAAALPNAREDIAHDFFSRFT